MSMSWDNPKYQITPDCCEQMRDTRAIVLRCRMDEETGTLDQVPHWELRLSYDWNLYGDKHDQDRDIWDGKKPGPDWKHRLDAATQGQHLHCPFCGKQVPELELRPEDQQPKKKVMTITDGGYYCASCNKRADACRCSPPWMRYQIKR